MKFPSLILLALSAAAAPAPAPAPEPAVAGPTVPPRRLLCSGLWTGNTLSWDDLKWAMENRRDELQLKAGWWNEANADCTSTDGRNIAQKGIWITYNHERDDKAATTLKYNNGVVCSPNWSLKCNPSG